MKKLFLTLLSLLLLIVFSKPVSASTVIYNDRPKTLKINYVKDFTKYTNAIVVFNKANYTYHLQAQPKQTTVYNVQNIKQHIVPTTINNQVKVTIHKKALHFKVNPINNVFLIKVLFNKPIWYLLVVDNSKQNNLKITNVYTKAILKTNPKNYKTIIEPTSYLEINKNATFATNSSLFVVIRNKNGDIIYQKLYKQCLLLPNHPLQITLPLNYKYLNATNLVQVYDLDGGINATAPIIRSDALAILQSKQRDLKHHVTTPKQTWDWLESLVILIIYINAILFSLLFAFWLTFHET